MNILLTPLDWIFGIITLIWLLEFFIFPSNITTDKFNKDTFYLILVSILIVVFLSIILSVFDIGVFIFYELKILSIILYFTGIILRYWSLILLGNNFSRHIEASEKQDLISIGPYKYLRHPLYLGLYLLTIAIPLFIGNILVLFLSMFLMFRVLKMRMEEEERIMEKIIGDRYISWKKKRYRFIPFIY